MSSYGYRGGGRGGGNRGGGGGSGGGRGGYRGSGPSSTAGSRAPPVSTTESSVSLYTNLYKMQKSSIKVDNYKILAFDKHQDPIQGISFDSLNIMIRKKAQQIKDIVGCQNYEINSGMLICLKPTISPEEFIVEFEQQEEDLFGVNAIYFSKSNEQSYSAIVNHGIYRGVLKKAAGKLNLMWFNNKYFSWPTEISLGNYKSILRPAFDITLIPFENNEMAVQILNKHLVFPKENLAFYIDLIKRINKNQINLIKKVSEDYFLGKPILLTHRTGLHRITSFEWPSNPTINLVDRTFELNDNRTVSFRQYFKEKYDITFSDNKTLGMPFVIHNDRNGVIHKFPACLCIPKGYDFRDGKEDSKLRGAVSRTTIKPIGARFETHNKFVDQLKNGIQKLPDNLNTTISPQPMVVTGVNLPMSMFQFEIGGNRTEVLNQYSTFNVNTLNQPSDCFRKWAIIIPSNYRSPVENVTRAFRDTIDGMRLNFTNPEILKVNNVDETLEKVTRDKFTAVVMISTSDNDYCKFKDWLSFKSRGIPSQVVRASTLEQPDEKRTKILKNIILQIQVKSGALGWKPSRSILNQAHIVIGIASQQHIGKDNRLFSFFADLGQQVKADFLSNHETCTYEEGTEHLITFTQNAIKKFKDTNGKQPELIIFYKLSSITNNLDKIMTEELKPLRKGLQNYKNLKIIVLYAVKDGRMRFSLKSYNSNAVADCSNPPPMTLVDKIGLKESIPQFYCVHQKVSPRATASPTLYYVLHNDMKTPDSFKQIKHYTTLSSCLYFNWQGSIPLPAPLMYADKNLKWLTTIYTSSTPPPVARALTTTPYML